MDLHQVEGYRVMLQDAYRQAYYEGDCTFAWDLFVRYCLTYVEQKVGRRLTEDEETDLALDIKQYLPKLRMLDEENQAYDPCGRR